MDLSKYLQNVLRFACFFLCYHQLLGRPKNSINKEELPTTQITQITIPFNQRKHLNTRAATATLRATPARVENSESISKTKHKVDGKNKTKVAEKKLAETKIKKSTKSKTKKKVPARLKEFPFQHLLNVGISSNEANTFIKNNQLRGKPLEQQYDLVREVDMNTIEDRLLKERYLLKRRS